MRLFFEILAALVVISAVAAATLGAAMYRRLRRATQLVPGRSSSAPLSWQWRPAWPARLHRRLQRACRTVESLLAPKARRRSRRDRDVAAASSVAAELVAQAAALDTRVVVAGRLREPWRRRALADLEVEVGRLETAASRLSALADGWSQAVSPPARLDINERVDALQRAYEEVGRLSAPQGRETRPSSPPERPAGALRRR